MNTDTSITELEDLALSSNLYDAAAIKNTLDLSAATDLDPSDATQEQICNRLNLLVRLLKGGIKSIMLAIMLVLPVSGFSKVHEDIATRQKDIPGRTWMYDAEAVEKRLSEITTITNHYPMFIIDMNSDYMYYKDGDDNPHYGLTEYIYVELKASTNNFYGTFESSIPTDEVVVNYKIGDINHSVKSIKDNVIYWAASGGTTDVFDHSMRTFATDKYAQDQTPKRDHRSLFRYEGGFDNPNYHNPKYDGKNKPDAAVKQVVVIIDYAAIVAEKGNADWLNDHNNNLVWGYFRSTVNGFPGYGEYTFEPCQPVKWFSEMPAWACTNNEVRVIR